MPGVQSGGQVAIQAGHRDTGTAVRPASQAADKAGSVLAWAAGPCWPNQGRGRSGEPNKIISILPIRVSVTAQEAQAVQPA